MVRRNGAKYGNKKTVIDGIKFDSIKEGKRYRQLSFMQKHGAIKDLECQPSFKFYEGEKWQFTYKADFRYFDIEKGQTIIEDVKSVATQKNSTYRLKKRLIQARFNIKITEVI